MGNDDVRTTLRREIEELHAFFTGWFRGDLDGTDASFARLERSLATEFTLVSPSGSVLGRDALIANLLAVHGRRPGFRIEIRNVIPIASFPPPIAASYEEWQADGERRTARLSTAVFREAAGAPNGLLWVRVHETWLPGRGRGTEAP